MNTSGTDPWEMGPIIAAGTAVAIDTAREPEPERRPPAEPEPEPGPGLEPDARCVDDAGSEDRANPAVDPWEIGPLPSASNPVGNDIPADAPASEPQHVGGAVEPADLADTIDLTPVGDRDAAMPSRIILCAMGTGRGLESLRALLADQSAGLFGASILLGAAITDPVPRMPRPLVAARIQLSSAVRVWRLPHIKGLELDGFPRRYPAAYSRLVKDVDAMPRATAHVG